MTPAPYPVPPGVRTACESNPALFFPDKGRTGQATAARRMCRACQFRAGCEAWAVTRGEEGIWGATDDDDRRRTRIRLGIVAVPVDLGLPRVRKPSPRVHPGGTTAGVEIHRNRYEPLCEACATFEGGVAS